MFAAGIILFIMRSGNPPFNEATPTDPFYKCLAANRPDVFWQTYEQDLDEGYYSEEFKDLVTALLKLDPSKRPTSEDILNHAWMKGPIPTTAEVVKEFEKRSVTMKKQMKSEKDPNEVMTKEHSHETVAFRHVDANDGISISKALYEYEKVLSQTTEFFSYEHPEIILQTLL